ncbi:MAG: hypothetical protein Q9167_004424 [Letrouitia subvulpina]
MFEAGRAGYTDTTPNGTSLLHVAARGTHVNLVSYLIECGADPNATNDDGEKLIQRGGDICSRNNEGKTPFHTFFRETNRELLACSYEIAETQLADERGMHLSHYVAWSSKSTVADIQPSLSEGRSNIFAKDCEGRSVLFFAAERGNLGLLEYFLKLQKRPNFSDVDINGLSLMHYAVRSKRVDAIDILHEHGYSASASDQNQQTAMHHAVKWQNLEGVKRLMNLYGTSQLKRVDNRGRSPQDLAQNTGEGAMIAYLNSVSQFLDNTMESFDASASCSEPKDALSSHQLSTQRIQWATTYLTFWRILAIFGVLVFGARALI